MPAELWEGLIIPYQSDVFRFEVGRPLGLALMHVDHPNPQQPPPRIYTNAHTYPPDLISPHTHWNQSTSRITTLNLSLFFLFQSRCFRAEKTKVCFWVNTASSSFLSYLPRESNQASPRHDMFKKTLWLQFTIGVAPSLKQFTFCVMQTETLCTCF